MSFREIGVKTISFGPEGGNGSEYPLAYATVTMNMVEDTAESGIVVIEDGQTDSTVTVDQMVSVYEAAIMKVSLPSHLQGEASWAAKEQHVAVSIVDTSGNVTVLPRCHHGAIEPPVVTFTAEDIKDPDGKGYWALINEVRVYGDKKVNFPDAIVN